MSQRTVTLELAGEHQLARDLGAGGVFVPGERLTLGEVCALVLRGRDEELIVTATSVWVDDRGTGLQLAGCNADMKQRIAVLAQSASAQRQSVALPSDELQSDELQSDELQSHEPPSDEPQSDEPQSDELQSDELQSHELQSDELQSDELQSDELQSDELHSDELQSDELQSDELSDEPQRDEPQRDEPSHDATSEAEIDAAIQAEIEAEISAEIEADIEILSAQTQPVLGAQAQPVLETVEPSPTADAEEDTPHTDEERKGATSINERLRGLTIVQQLKIAQHGEASERVLLERMYGKNVWEALLRNPRITGPEVARIARMAALPRTLIEIIVGNGGWLQIPEVRRAVLSNPRLGTDQILRVLRLLPKHELKLAGMQTAYPFAVRDVAKRMLREMAGG